MKNAFEGLICRLGMTTEKVTEFEYMSSETSPNEIQTKKKIIIMREEIIQKLRQFQKL